VQGVHVDLIGTISVDAGGDPTQHLQNMRDRFPDAKEHTSDTAALANVAGAAEGTLVGHGWIGRINTGAGNVLSSNPDTFIGLANRTHWRAAIATMGQTRLQRLLLFSCDTGANQDGANVVFELAKALGAQVQAPNGNVWIDPASGELFMVERAEFQCADPSMSSPPPVKDHVSVPVDAVAPGHYALVFEDGAFVEVPSRAIRGIRVQVHRTADALQPLSAQMEGADAARFAASVALNAPLVFGGQPASIVTGTLSLQVRVGGRDVVHEYRIYNNRLIEDVVAPGVFYQFGAPGLVL
jgi:hypothetical protein